MLAAVNFMEQITQIKSIQSIETNNKTIRPSPHIKIVVSKRELKDGDIDLIYELLYSQNYYEWTFEMVA
jgi:hypothetical protein